MANASMDCFHEIIVGPDSIVRLNPLYRFRLREALRHEEEKSALRPVLSDSA